MRCLAKLHMLLSLIVTSVAVLYRHGSLRRGLKRRALSGKVLSCGLLLNIDGNLVD